MTSVLVRRTLPSSKSERPLLAAQYTYATRSGQHVGDRDLVMLRSALRDRPVHRGLLSVGYPILDGPPGHSF